MTSGLSPVHRVESIELMNPNPLQPVPARGTEDVRDILIRRVDQQKQAAGIVAGVIEPKGRRIIPYGNLAAGDPRTLDGDTIFEIGSITKIFTSLLLADMAEHNEVALGDPATMYLPEGVRLPERSGRAITLRDLSSHTSGLPRLPDNLKPADPANPYAGYGVDDLYAFLAGFVLPREPGAEVEYSNLGAGLLGHILARRAGMEFESAIGSRITRPLGMPDTRITLSSSMKQRMATGHNALLAPVVNWDFLALAGAGALRSSANDMLTLLEAFLGYKESPLTPAMKVMVDQRRPVGSTNFAVGLGWNVLGEMVWHDGGTGGFRSFIGYDTRTRTGVVVLSNAATPSGVADLGIHLLNPNAPLGNFASAAPPRQHIEISVSPSLIDHYVGRYQLMPNLILEISREADRLFAQAFAHGNAAPKFEVFAESENCFFAKVTEKQIVFEADPDGQVNRLVMHAGGRQPMSGIRLP